MLWSKWTTHLLKSKSYLGLKSTNLLIRELTGGCFQLGIPEIVVEYSILWAWSRPSCFHTRDLGKQKSQNADPRNGSMFLLMLSVHIILQLKNFCRRFRNLNKKIASTAIEVYFSVTHHPSSKHVLMSRNASSYFFFLTLSCIYCTVDRKIFYKRRFWKLDGQFSMQLRQ